ncbi:MAG: LysM peptidoglycan-binding domain-containing M23 family metallopeptidase [Anaerolineae bacterium]
MKRSRGLSGRRPRGYRWHRLLALGAVSLGAVSLSVACYRHRPTPQARKTESSRREGTSPAVAVTPAAEAHETRATDPPPTPVTTPSPAYPGRYTGTPTPNPTPVGYGQGSGIDSYTVQPGETLSLIAAVYGCSVEEIVAANGLASADSIGAGQTLKIPTVATRVGPSTKLIPDSEMVYGPATIGFDLEGFIMRRGGYLADYTEDVEGKLRFGPDIVQIVSQRFSVGPRVLLTLLEMQSGWVSEPQPAAATLTYPIGHVQAYQEGLFQQLSWAAVRLNEGYYGWKHGDRTTVLLANGTRIGLAPEINAGTAGVQNALAELASSEDGWLADLGPDGFSTTYRRFFGNPFSFTVDPLVPQDLVQPELRLPWPSGEMWYYTGGPHGGWGTGSGLSALDFVPGGKMLGCAPAPDWATAAAPGLVLRSDNGEVILDLDGDGFEQSGWVLLYMHVHSQDRVEEGAWLQQGQPIGHPSCEGGFADATHLHLARRYNGEWIPAGSGSRPMVLSGWTAHEAAMPYEGTMTRDAEERVACECWEADINGLISDNAVP